MRQRGPLYATLVWLCLSLVSLGLAQPTSSGDQPIVPNPNALPESESPSPTPSPSAAANPSPTPAATADPKAGIYIADSGNHRIMFIKDLSGEGRKVLGRPGHEPGYFLHPSQVWVDPLGKIFVADRDNNRIVRMDEISGTGWTTMPGFNHPEGVASRGDEIYVADTGNNQVIVYANMDGRPLRSYKDPRLAHPTGLWLDQNKDLYVSCGQDPPGGRVVKIVDPADASGAKWEVYEGQNLKQVGFAPSQMLTWKSQLWMIDPVGNRIARVDNFQGRSAREWGGYGSQIGKFHSPYGLGLSKEGSLFVADSGNDRIVEIKGLDPKEWKSYTGNQEGVQLRNPTSVFSWSPCPAPPPPPEDPDKKGKGKRKPANS